ncbi:hypothetical protein WEU38_09430 [Cyanobacterium aponinum AL20118]|uniref:Uncharacterized protein n=1 Tax=Cyanobacterium aponinum AL20115 TaxID=3090662 RepID=A0AAF1C4I5_9CHRO|nr:hypothetical protein [Cyanobacterium aponinum]MBD2392932.1 hypothetical protein [Cyanobacterium aponinum FACHB-4101]PHV62273.1 hypothetical protein CSQ80_11205 [Cyanobacterium aponinum IPPAS B-1201]WPF87040.1 hypothetical protein SAY89_09445 [Cyanobacterium aponinum AL20115]
MNNFESRQSQPKLNNDEGWVVQVYGSNRRLLCVLEPSHGWIFLIGCGFGLLLSIIWFNVARYSPSLDTAPPVDSAPLQVD